MKLRAPSIGGLNVGDFATIWFLLQLRLLLAVLLALALPFLFFSAPESKQMQSKACGVHLQALL